MNRESTVTVSQKWNKRVEQWHDHVTSAEAFRKVLDRILVLSQPRGSDVCVDLGAGTGFVTTALAPLVASVLAVDISPAMTNALAGRAADAGLANVSTEVADLKDFRLPPSHADLIVSSYALHHLADADKRALTARAARGLRPGGRLVIADMMFGRGRSRRDRAILRQKAAALAAKGIGGWWRIAKNLTRYGLRIGPERPATPEFWQQALRDAGLAEVRFHPVAAEAGIVCGVRQRSSLRHEAGRRLRAAGRISGRGQNREEIPGPSGEELVGWTVLARYLGGEHAARSARPTIQYQRRQILPNAVDGLARRGQPTPPDPDPGPPGPVDHQAGEARQQRTDHMPFLHVAARASRQLEPAVKRGKKLAAFGAGHSRPRRGGRRP
jgi:ubiquinone/menaquinone biosynthesis C-methylase UbiE